MSDQISTSTPGLDDELPAFRMLQRRRHRRLDAKLIRLVRLAFANAFDLRRMQAEDAQVGAWRLAPDGAQILVLRVNAARQHEGVREDFSQSLVARNLARCRA